MIGRIRPVRNDIYFATLLLASVLLMFYSLQGILDSNDINDNGWALDFIDVTAMHNEGYYGNAMKIGIVDTGVDIGNKEFDGMKIIYWADLVNNRETPYDDNGHGTMMMGILAGNKTVKGVAPAASFVVVKSLTSSGEGDISVVAQGINICIAKNVDVIVLSLGGKSFKFMNTPAENAVNDAINRGIVVVASAGNNGDSANNKDVSSPADDTSVIAVGAIDKNMTIAPFSSKGSETYQSGFFRVARTDPDKKPEIVCPGVSIVTPYPGNKYVIGSGTSHAAAFAGGTIALALEYSNVTLNTYNDVIELKNEIMKTAVKVPDQKTPHDDYYGYGLLKGMALGENLTAIHS